MCLVTNEGRAPARTARPPLRLPRPAARCQVAGEGARCGAGGGAGRRAGGRQGPGRRPAAEREQRRHWLWAFR